METVYMQATTGKLHRRRNCSITSRTRYEHFPVDFTPERAASCERCNKCWDGFKPERVSRCPMCGGDGGYDDVCDAHVSERGA